MKKIITTNTNTTNTKLNDLKALVITKDDAKKVKGGIIIEDWDIN
jgi:hypothetical protein